MQRRPPRRPGGRRRPSGGASATTLDRNGPAAPVLPKEPVDVPASLSVKEFAERTGVSASTVIRELLQNGVIASINQTIDFDTAAIVAADMGFEVREMAPLAQAEIDQTEDRPEDLVPRPPVVTVM